MISCIIPAYNETTTVAEVVHIVSSHPRITEVIIVDDGSTDTTAQALNAVAATSQKIKIITHPTNRGKKEAVKTGLANTTQPYVLFLDADLINLTHQDIDALIEPVLNNHIGMTLSSRTNTTLYAMYFNMIGVHFLTGDRCAKKEIFDHGYTLGTTGYGIEVLLNDYLLKNNISFLPIPIGARSLSKLAKRGVITGLRDDLRMLIQIIQASSFRTLVRQSVVMPKRIKVYKAQLQTKQGGK